MAAAEQKKQYHVTKAFRGVNTKANRTAIDVDEFSWIENAQPIGYANMKVLPTSSNVTISGSSLTWGNTVDYITTANVNNTAYIVAFEADGRAEYYNIAAGTKGNVAVAGTFSSANVRATLWKDERLLIADPTKGYFTWDGTNTVFVGSVGQIAITAGGSGYTTTPSVVISAPNDANGVQAVATATTSSGAVTAITLTEAGTGYTSPPTITLSGGGGSGATAIAGLITFKKGTVAVTVSNPGSGYTNAANLTVSFSGGGGANAAATAVLSGGQISTIVMTNPGDGYTSNPTVTITGGGGSNATAKAVAAATDLIDVASFAGRVWLARERTVTYSAAATYEDFITVSAGAIVLTDSTLFGHIQGLLSANNFLYIFGESSINVFSDVRVTSTGETLFTNTNISASIGTKRTLTAFPYFRTVLFMNDYGVYALVGSTTSKISDALDGIFPNIDITYPMTGGQVLLNNILCAAFNFRYNDPTQGARYIQAVFFDKKWFFTSQGDIAYVTSIPYAGSIRLYGTSGTNLKYLYNDTTSNISTRIQSALWQLGDVIRDKQALKLGVEATLTTASNLSLTVDSENRVSPTYTLTNTGISWVNNAGNTLNWLNNASSIINWTYSSGYALYKSDAQQFGKYLGYTITSTDPGFTLNTLEMEYELRARF